MRALRWLTPLLLPGVALAAGGGAVPGGPTAVAGLWLDGEFACSAVLFGEDRAVTAGHCVSHLPPDDLSAELRFGDVVVGVSGATLHPDLFAAPDADLAVLWLDAIAPVPPVELAASAPDEDWDLWEVRVAGWGASNAEELPAGALRSFEARVEDLSETHLLFDGGEAFVCHGDSGGAVLHDGPLGELLVGVVVGGASDCFGRGDSVRVDRFARFLADPFGAAPGEAGFGADDDEEGPAATPGAGRLDGFEDEGAGPSAAGCAVHGRSSGASLLGLMAIGVLAVLGRRRRGASSASRSR